MLDTYSNFFVASTGASAAFIGLLFVALTIANQEEMSHPRRARREALSGSSFAQLLDAFFVSIVGLMGNVYILATVSVALAGWCLWVTSQLLPQVIRSGHWARNVPDRTSNIVLPVVSIAVYVLQVVFGVLLLFHSHNSDILRFSVLVILGLYGSALTRSWKITRT